LAFKPNIKFSTTHYAEGNSMASPIQRVVGKGKLNPLIAEDLLKILRDLIPFDSSKILYQFFLIEWWIHKANMLKLSPLTFPYVIVACLQSHPPLFDWSRLDFTIRSFKYSNKPTERIYLMTYRAKRIEESSKCIFAELFQYFYIHAKVWQPIDQSGAKEKSPRNRWNLPIKLSSECTNDYSLQREFILIVTLMNTFDDF